MRTDVIVFVDWNSQFYNAGVNTLPDPVRKAMRTLQFVQEKISCILSNFDRTQYYLVQLRLYHGWHRGFTPTDNKSALDKILSRPDLTKVIGRVSFSGGIKFGYNLNGVGEYRRCRNIRIHLPDTDREPVDATKLEAREKMVDTAMACDVLSSARSNASDWRLIMSETMIWSQ